MKWLKIYFSGLIFTLLSAAAFAQGTDVAATVKEGIQLNSAGNYAGAMEKYKQALTAEPDNPQANYQLAFSLFASGKGTEGIPYLNKVTVTTGTLTGPAYDLLGSIYDAAHQPQQAIDAYKAGIAASPTYQRLYFNLGIAYFRSRQYAEAEQQAVEAIKLDPEHASSQRLYALVTFHQNKRAEALLGFCSFLLLEPETARSAEAYTNMQSILKGGVLKEEGAKPLDADNAVLNKALSAAVATANQQKPADPLEAQLKAIFETIGQLAQKQTGNDFFRNYYAAFFYRLAQSGNMPAFAKLAGLSANKAANSQWLKDNDDRRKALDAWVAGDERKF